MTTYLSSPASRSFLECFAPIIRGGGTGTTVPGTVRIPDPTHPPGVPGASDAWQPIEHTQIQSQVLLNMVRNLIGEGRSLPFTSSRTFEPLSSTDGTWVRYRPRESGSRGFSFGGPGHRFLSFQTVSDDEVRMRTGWKGSHGTLTEAIRIRRQVVETADYNLRFFGAAVQGLRELLNLDPEIPLHEVALHLAGSLMTTRLYHRCPWEGILAWSREEPQYSYPLEVLTGPFALRYPEESAPASFKRGGTISLRERESRTSTVSVRFEAGSEGVPEGQIVMTLGRPSDFEVPTMPFPQELTGNLFLGAWWNAALEETSV